MNSRRIIAVFFIISMLILYVVYQFNKASGFPVLRGPYLGQPVPEDSSEVFAPNLISTGLYTRDMAISPDGNEIYFSVVLGKFQMATIMQSKQVHSKWTEPEVAPFAVHPDYKSLEPAISPDGQMFYFASNRPDEAVGEKEAGDFDIWFMRKTETGWSEPENLGLPVNSDSPEFFPSITRDRTLYFTRDDERTGASAIFRSQFVNGAYETPEKLGPVVNSGRSQFNAYVSPDEDYLIVPVYGREDSFGATDYYICYRDETDAWSGPFHLGARINSASGEEYSPYVSPDGKFFFFMSTRPNQTMKEKRGALYPMTWQKIWKHFQSPDNDNPNINWISAEFINQIRMDHHLAK